METLTGSKMRRDIIKRNDVFLKSLGELDTHLVSVITTFNDLLAAVTVIESIKDQEEKE